MTLIIELVPHMDAGDRSAWQGNQNERPLSDLGWRQAEALVQALNGDPVGALYSSPALRCVQTLQPLADRAGLEVAVLPELEETFDWQPPPGWAGGAAAQAYGGAFSAGRALTAIGRLRAGHGNGRVVACSHGDVIPALVSCLAGMLERGHVAQMQRRGQWYSLLFDPDLVGIELRAAREPFPR